MNPREVQKYLYDILGACRELERYSRGKTFKEYASDSMLRSAVERQFEIVGEALNQALKSSPALASRGN